MKEIRRRQPKECFGFGYRFHPLYLGWQPFAKRPSEKASGPGLALAASRARLDLRSASRTACSAYRGPPRKFSTTDHLLPVKDSSSRRPSGTAGLYRPPNAFGEPASGTLAPTGGERRSAAASKDSILNDPVIDNMVSIPSGRVFVESQRPAPLGWTMMKLSPRIVLLPTIPLDTKYYPSCQPFPSGFPFDKTGILVDNP